MKRIAVCPGSFDPITLGHVDLIRRATRLFDHVIVAVAADAQKQHVFSVDERVEMAIAACEDLSNLTVHSLEGLLVQFCRQHQATAIVKGLRSAADMPHEMQMQAINADLAPEIETVFVPASASTAHICASMVRWLSQLGVDISCYVPPMVAEQLALKYGNPAQ
jgi:pantetheine-phosphate adenylyltransferase